jgi:hypothetical protein
MKEDRSDDIPEEQPDEDPQLDASTLELDPECYPDVSNLITEDDKPVESIYIEKQYRLLTDPLDNSWAGTGDGKPFLALTNVGLFFAARNPPLVPDFLLSLKVELPPDLMKKEHRSYFVWLFGKPPEVVGEIVSDRRGGEDTLKLEQYASLGIKYYFIYDPRNLLGGGELRVFGLSPEGYVLVPDNSLKAVGLSLIFWEGTYSFAHQRWLRWRDKDNRLIPTGGELAEEAVRRSDEEKRRVDELAERVKRLEAQLRAQGIDPLS